MRGQWAGATLVVVLTAGLSGCATKGYVRSQMEGLKTEMVAGQDELRAEIGDARNSIDQALARADAASGLAGTARDLALGKCGFREVARYTVLFEYNSDELAGDVQLTLDEIASRLDAHPEYLADVVGFTDSKGSPRYNYELGRRRAESVVRGLSERVPGSLHRYAALSYGEAQPASAPELATDQDRRRVEVNLVERVAEPGEMDSMSQAN